MSRRPILLPPSQAAANDLDCEALLATVADVIPTEITVEAYPYSGVESLWCGFSTEFQNGRLVGEVNTSLESLAFAREIGEEDCEYSAGGPRVCAVENVPEIGGGAYIWSTYGSPDAEPGDQFATVTVGLQAGEGILQILLHTNSHYPDGGADAARSLKNYAITIALASV